MRIKKSKERKFYEKQLEILKKKRVYIIASEKRKKTLTLKKAEKLKKIDVKEFYTISFSCTGGYAETPLENINERITALENLIYRTP